MSRPFGYLTDSSLTIRLNRSYGGALYCQETLDRLVERKVALSELQWATRRMLQALDGYWLHCDGLPRDRRPLSRSDAGDWWGRWEKYRKIVETCLAQSTR
jgi:hypothetical protein